MKRLVIFHLVGCCFFWQPNTHAQTRAPIAETLSRQATLEEITSAKKLYEQNWMGIKYQNGYLGPESGPRGVPLGPTGKPLPVPYEHQSGWDVKKDISEAVRWYRNGAEAGDPAAQANLGFLFENGLGVERNYDQAVTWYRKAAEKGDASAQSNLGVIFQKGKGVEKNYVEAFKWFWKSANQEFDTAQYNLAVMYAEGMAVETNYVEAYAWLKLSQTAGNKKISNSGVNTHMGNEFSGMGQVDDTLEKQQDAEAQKRIKQLKHALEKTMSSAQIHEAQKRIKQLEDETPSRIKNRKPPILIWEKTSR